MPNAKDGPVLRLPAGYVQFSNKSVRAAADPRVDVDLKVNWPSIWTTA